MTRFGALIDRVRTVAAPDWVVFAAGMIGFSLATTSVAYHGVQTVSAPAEVVAPKVVVLEDVELTSFAAPAFDYQAISTERYEAALAQFLDDGAIAPHTLEWHHTAAAASFTNAMAKGDAEGAALHMDRSAAARDAAALRGVQFSDEAAAQAAHMRRAFDTAFPAF